MLRGDEQAFSQCYQRTSPIIYSAIFRICQNKASAEDILQETYIQAFSSLDKLHKHEKFLSWIKRIAFNKTISWIRAHQKTHIKIDESREGGDSVSEEDIAIQFAVNNDLTRLLQNLQPQSRLVLWMYAIEGYSHREIADMHNKSLSFSKVIVSRALNTLKQDSKVILNVK